MTDDTWTVKRILEWIEGYLAQHGDENPRVSAQWLVSEALGVSRMQLFLDAQRPLSGDERAVLRDWTRRRAAGEPLQYITGETAFRHITVKVRPGVLIPRPETEVLVSEALALLPAAPKPQDVLDEEFLRQIASLSGELGPASGENGRQGGSSSASESGGTLASAARLNEPADAIADASADAIADAMADASTDAMPDTMTDAMADAIADDDLESATPRRKPAELLIADICTGSGCIACSIAHEHKGTRVIATDISPEAVALARENVSALSLDGRVEVLECDLGEGVDPALAGTFDLVVSNPPYVPTVVLAGIPHEVADYEPALALDGGPDGLAVFRRLLDWCARALAPGGAFAFELHETCLDDAAAEAEYAGFADVRVAHDLAGRPRVLTGRKR